MSQGSIPAAIALKPGGGYTLAKVDANGNLLVSQGAPEALTTLAESSGSVANAVAAATLPAAAGKFNYLAGVSLTGLGATAAGVSTVTITGLNGGTMTFDVQIPAGVTLGIVPLNLTFNPPLQSSAINTAVTASATAFGAGNTAAAMNAWGYAL